ncbi:methylated-DNA--[protein]-cysteine S-methyltransferase [Occultella glacieicola]|uniref:Methylated-DNA--protein-cysteine methyltransferase n=1 Tax=Occultella glacieicola TaxID=2518684 RepID=A0ABY2EAE1_9MICO|nr:methylated-DNA--[protein]-cysteine S-methyltransferase [Occultella glacieicola]TDE98916.1 methylated-DNA--[protein]-cysteine S-methyltransferase [Occultella glacieicola]
MNPNTIARSGEPADLIAGTTPDRDTLDRLHQRLVETAGREGLVDVAYTEVDSPVGRLLLATTDVGLVRLAYDREGFEEVLGGLAAGIGPRVLRAPARLAPAARQLEEYFAGKRTAFDLALDRRLSHGFRGLVQRHLPDISYGHTESYREVALRVGNPGAVRAVGSACATNPLPVVVPCHRVLRADGSLGGYVGGPDAKAALLRLERAA